MPTTGDEKVKKGRNRADFVSQDTFVLEVVFERGRRFLFFERRENKG
jgi:hypothetical protein